MGIKIEAREGPALGINSSAAMFEKLKYESARLRDKWHPYDAFNFLVTAWHLFEDWTKSDNPGAMCRMKRQRKRLPKEMNFLLDVVRDLVNGSKHFQLTPDAAAKRRVAAVHAGREASFYSYFYHEDLAAVTVEDHWYFSIRVLHNIVMRYFEWVFDDSRGVKDFPEGVLDAISYCHIPTRVGPPPGIWVEF